MYKHSDKRGMYKRNSDGVVMVWDGKKYSVLSASKKYFDVSKHKRLISKRSRKINRK